MKRFFSIPGLRWRRDVKQFEKDVYDNWADGYDRSIWAPWLHKWVDSLAEDIPPGCSIVDIGCGTGSALLRLARENPVLLAGVDISPKAIAVAKDKLSGLPADVRLGDAEAQLPWPDETFDVAIMTAAIHHFPNPENVLCRVFQVLRPKGRLIIADPFFFFPILQIVNLLLKIYPLNGDLHFFSQRGLRKLVKRCGFENIGQKRAAFFAKYTVAQKPNPAQSSYEADWPRIVNRSKPCSDKT
jgi:ubiquinone/menaquinone biosynthesis C-methylase UbiE